MGVKEHNLPGAFDSNSEIPVELTLSFGSLVSQGRFYLIAWDVVHVSGTDCSCHV
jgi:hypothetical protein